MECSYCDSSKNSLDKHHQQQLTSLICLQIDSLSIRMLKMIIEFFVERLRNKKSFNEINVELFVESIKYLYEIKSESDENDTGEAYVRNFMQDLFSIELSQQKIF
jgi:hypothetical protein